MAEDDDAFASKILLMRAANRSKAKSWLAGTSLPGDYEDENDAQDDLSGLQGNDELSGIGAPKTNEDNIENRQLLSANEALRRKLLGKDAYKKYQQGTKNKLDTSKPLPKKVSKQVESDDEDQGKGRSSRGSRMQKVPPRTGTDQMKHDGPAIAPVSSSAPKGKKRPGSYLDQLLAQRGKKKKEKSDSKGD